ncbi:MAG: hypothetical protein WDM81_07025 [Rhizomicrobium sp.]
MTQDSPYGKQLSASVAYVFRANANLTYLCNSGPASAIAASPAGSAPENSYRDAAQAGQTITCVMPATFSKIEEGWNFRIFSMDALAYAIRR